MKLTKFIAAFGIMIIAATNVNAQATANRGDKIKIKQGVKSGELTKKETVRLARQQKDIRQDVKSAKADGVVTREERKNIKREKRRADRTIYRKKHNNRDRN
jgi:hypothetical protein